MAIHKLFKGGDLVGVGHTHTRKADSQSDLVRYAGHLPTRHFVLDFAYDGGDSSWAEYAEMHGAFATGDVLHTHLLSRDTRVNSVVFSNKKPAGAVDEVSRAITTPAKVKVGLYDGDTLVAQTDDIDLSVIGLTVLEFTAVAKKGKVVKDTNNDGVVTDADAPATLTTSQGAYLGNNGSVRVTVVDGTGISTACFAVFADVVDFLSASPCSCAKEPCGAEYPDPVCA